MKLSEILHIITSDLEQVEEELEENVGSIVPLAYELSRYILESGGKRLRPSVVLLSSGACGLTNGKERIDSAVAIELIHTATLLHDDVVDEADTRRGKRASNVVWGSKASVLVGDFMLARALGLLSSTGSLEAIRSVTDAAAKLAEGQVFEVMIAKNMIEVSEEICFDIIKNKTASLIESCGQVGAILACTNGEMREALGNYGFNLGIAFQLIDDALDYSADEQEFGKKIGQDLNEGKMTLPLVYALREASSREKSMVMDVFQNNDFEKEGPDFVMGIVEKYNGVQQTKTVAQEFAEKAKRALAGVPQSTCRKSLDLLADHVVERRK
jgi:octaprenyl-diphosphate synthase